ncbi:MULTISPECIES: glycerol-3-phosphate 1-O-acyltransferase PlsY [unclassified Pseudodesulfovibrio]|uniref:glycerol-3-phosphate 1-O-acyltransferase PlsY n=1 Tax=unclassified Pseudodesulfovibrio TaxID=2661612 RepID=UPI000FEB9C31|nr:MULTISPECIES: glycerol-3-phosphate 1-O-acyltransferase PlsY [unclassified Pseudodesulfovibrio]MCJ2165911.1 glycerol-3-phosphate 1-O-acyltransferase PlsY [Pseudodesulfovibrio sp. S3-i]RWU02657.1 glycerol-3-phosphate 1-O-acyltransferase [Pseudodesulfovibrio sp. S3]
MIFIFWAALAYVLGSIPFGLVIAKTLCSIDPRLDGSKNTGATNVARLCGTKYGIATLVMDVFKGFLPVIFAAAWIESDMALSLVGLAAILGHIFSCFMHFKGGKAVATTVGVFFALAPWAAALSGILCLGVVWLSGHVSMGSLTLALALPVFTALTGHFGTVPVALIVMVILFWRHKDNIRRLARGEENPWLKKE